MAKEYVPIFFDWLQVTEELNDQEKGRLIDAIVLFASGGDWQDRIKGNERYLFPAFREQINRSNQISEARAIAGSKPKQTETKANKPEQTETNGAKANEEEDNNNNNKEDEKKEHSMSVSAKRFVPPTPEDLHLFCLEVGITIDEDRFINYYQSNGWKVGRNAMKDWKATARNWARQDQKKDSGVKTVVAQDYDQRDYEETRERPEDMLRRLMSEGA